MTSTTASAVRYIDDDFLLGQRSELTARKRSYREQVDRLSAAVEELADADDAPDLGDDEGFAEANPASVERDRVLSLAALARRRIEDIDAALRRQAPMVRAGRAGGQFPWRGSRPYRRPRSASRARAARCSDGGSSA